MEQILQDFLDLVQIDAASRDERAVADAVRAKMEALGMTVEEDRAGDTFGGITGNLFAVVDGGLPGSLLLNSHLDRVAGGLGIKPQIRDGMVASDGTTILAADDLSGVCAILDGVRRVKASGKPFPRLEILFTVGEEAGLFGSKAFDKSRLQAKMGFVFDSPGPVGRVVIATPARATLVCEVFGKGAHAGSCPEKGINAVTALAKILATIRDGRLDSESTANFAILETGSKSPNAVQHYAKVTGETRSLSHQKLKDYMAYFEKHCREAVEGTGATVKTEMTPSFGNFRLTEDAHAVRIARKAMEKMGLSILAEAGGGGMDADIFNAAGIQCIGVATGYSGNHSRGETLSLKDFLQAGELAQKLIETFAEDQ